MHYTCKDQKYNFTTKAMGQLGTLRFCNFSGCKFAILTHSGQRRGRAYGFVQGNKNRGAMIQHSKTHAEAS